MTPEISDYNSILVVDHELLEDVHVPNQKLRVKSLKDARRALLENSFNAIVFLSLLEESNEIETFVNGLRSHPTLKALPVFCEQGLVLALPKDLNLITFQESSLHDPQDEDFEDNEDLLDIENLDSLPCDKKVDIKSFLYELKELTAKSYVLFEMHAQDNKSRQELINDYFAVLKSEIR